MLLNNLFWKLDANNKVIPCDGVEDWVGSAKTRGFPIVVDRYVDKEGKEILVSTIFFGTSSAGDGSKCFETMAWHKKLEEPIQQRCDTWEEAQIQHNEIVKRIQELDNVS